MRVEKALPTGTWKRLPVGRAGALLSQDVSHLLSAHHKGHRSSRMLPAPFSFSAGVRAARLCVGFGVFSRNFLLRGRWCVSSLGLLRWDPRSVPPQRRLVVTPVLTASSVNPRSGFVMCPADPGGSFWAAAGSSCAAPSPFSTQGLCSCCSPAWVPAQSHVLHRRGDGDHGCARCLLEFFPC